jgi:hypothetical protein
VSVCGIVVSYVILTTSIDGQGVSKMCGKTATVSWKGKSVKVKVKVVDECPVCGYDNIGLSPSAFEQLADKSECDLTDNLRCFGRSLVIFSIRRRQAERDLLEVRLAGGVRLCYMTCLFWTI